MTQLALPFVLPEDIKPERLAAIVYAAGFFDGEGSIGIYAEQRGQRPQIWKLRLSAEQRKDAPLGLLRDLFGGRVYLKKARGTRRACFCWTAEARTAVQALVELRPFLLVKADEADAAIAFQMRRTYSGSALNRLLDPRDSERLKELKRA